MAWASDVIIALAIMLAIVVSGVVATGRIMQLLEAGLAGPAAGPRARRRTVPA